jgi:glycosyltransferase involved in cell wall biosynthesis
MTKTDGPFGGRRLDFAFISSNLDWGGSEDLWSEAAARLARAGHSVRCYKNDLPRGDGNIGALRKHARMIELGRFPLLAKALYRPIRRFARPLDIGWQAVRLYASLRLRRRPDLVVMSQGGNHDGWPLAAVCRRLLIPYVLISHKATDLYWPVDRWLPAIDRCYAGARHCFFVSEHSRRLTEEQLGRRLPASSIARNPFRVSWAWRGAWPDDGAGLRLACVGRLAPREKGQDLLLRVLALPKWRERPVSVTFFGAGEQREGLEAMARYHGLGSVVFAGHVGDVDAIWRTHHALVLPSRAEGLPLVLVEAMLCGRVPIVTDVGGNAELMEDGVTGFVAASPTEQHLDEALERAWRRRSDWPRIGAEAARSVRATVPADPAGMLAQALVRLAGNEPLAVAEARLSAVPDTGPREAHRPPARHAGAA